MSINVDEFTVPEKILLAAETLDKQGQSPFSAETLIVESWKRFPRTFGLKGYVEQHPDSNKILSSVMGEKGLVRRGWLVKMGQKLYSLTHDGRRVVRRITQDDEPLPSSLVKLSLAQDHFLRDLLDSSAYQKYDQDRKAELTFADACRFWGVTENMKGDALDERIDQFHRRLTELERLLAEGDAVLSNGFEMEAGGLRVLTNLHHYMEDRFDRHLNLLKSRTRK